MSTIFADDSEQAQAYNKVNSAPHKAQLSHELIVGAVAYEAAKAYEEHSDENGQPDSHARSKELIAGFTGAFIDRIIETKGLDAIDREKVHREAQLQAQKGVDNHPLFTFHRPA